MEMAPFKAFQLKLIRKGEKIPSETLKNFPFWLTSAELASDCEYWPGGEPPEEVEPVGEEQQLQFPSNFYGQRLLFCEDGFEIWTPDWVEISKKHDGILFVVEGANDIVPDDYEFLSYPSVHAHLRFRSELTRTAAIENIRKLILEQQMYENAPKEQQDSVILFFGEYPESVFYAGHEEAIAPNLPCDNKPPYLKVEFF